MVNVKKIFLQASLGILVVTGLTMPAQAQEWRARRSMTSSQYQNTFNNLVDKGYRLQDVSGYEVNGQAQYAALWVQESGPAWVARHGLTGAQYQATFNDLVDKGYRLENLSAYNVNGNARFAALWVKESGPAWVARHGLTSAQYQAKFDELADKGYRLERVSGYDVNGQARYAALWVKKSGPAWQARHGLTGAQYQAAFNDLVGKGYRLEKVSAYSVNGKARFAAIWSKGPGPAFYARHGLTFDQYRTVNEARIEAGYRLEDISGYTHNGNERYAAIWVK